MAFFVCVVAVAMSVAAGKMKLQMKTKEKNHGTSQGIIGRS